MSSAVLEARAVILGQDRTKAAFDSIEARINKLVGRIAAIDKVMGRVEQISGPINRATAEIAKFDETAHSLIAVNRQVEAVRKSFAETASSIDKATASARNFEKVRLRPLPVGRPELEGHGSGRVREHGHSRLEALREIGAGVAPLVGLGIAYEGAEVVRSAVHGGMERQHERTRMSTSGMKPDEIRDTEGLSANLAAQYPAVGQTEIMHLMRNARSVVGSYDEAAKILQPLLDLRVVAQGAHPGEDMKEEFDQLIKGMEIKGVTQDPAKFRSYINSMGKAVNAFGDTLRPTDFYEMFKYGRQSTSGFSQDYMMTVAPTLAQEMKGSSAGVANSAFFRAIVGGRMEKGALARLEALDLVNKSKLIVPKGGHIASAAGAIKGTELAQLNPYEWVNQILLPAMNKKGIVDPQKIQEVINSVFSNQVAAQMVGIYATQQARIEKDRGVIAGTMETPEAARQIMQHDPIMAAEGLKNALENLGTVFADKTLNLAGGMTSAAEAIGRYTAGLQQAYERQEKGGTEPVLPGQAKFNQVANAFGAWTKGWEDGGSSGDVEEGKRASMLAEARRRGRVADGLDRGAESADYDIYENSRNAGQLRHDAVEHDPTGFWESLVHTDNQGVFMRQNADTLAFRSQQAREKAQQARDEAEAYRNAGQLGQELSGIGQQIDQVQKSSWYQATTHMPNAVPQIPEGPAWFPKGRSYEDVPLPGDLPQTAPAPSAPGAPAAVPEEHHTISPDDFKAAFAGSNFVAQLDPNSKASVEISLKVEPGSDLFKLVAAAQAASSSGNISASVSGGSVGTTSPTLRYRGPAGVGHQ